MRTTPTFDAETVPAGLLREHRIAPGVWGVLRVTDGSIDFVIETSGTRRTVSAGDSQVIEPDVPHRVDLGAGAMFNVEFYR